MTCVVVGGSAGLGRALAGRLAAAGEDLIIVSSDARDVSATAADLAIRYGRRVWPLAVDVADVKTYLAELTRLAEETGGIDGFLFPIGAILPGDDGTLSPAKAEWLTRVNYLSVVSTLAGFLPALKARPRAVVVGFGSVAAARGRGVNVVYGSAKRALAAFFESLRRLCVGSNLNVQFYVLGYIDTNLAFGRRTWLPRADPDALGARVVRDLWRDVGVVYYPGIWRWLCWALRALPWRVFKHIRVEPAHS